MQNFIYTFIDPHSRKKSNRNQSVSSSLEIKVYISQQHYDSLLPYKHRNDQTLFTLETENWPHRQLFHYFKEYLELNMRTSDSQRLNSLVGGTMSWMSSNKLSQSAVRRVWMLTSMASQRRSLQEPRLRQNRSPPVWPDRAPSAGCFLPSRPCRRQPDNKSDAAYTKMVAAAL